MAQSWPGQRQNSGSLETDMPWSRENGNVPQQRQGGQTAGSSFQPKERKDGQRNGVACKEEALDTLFHEEGSYTPLAPYLSVKVFESGIRRK